MEIRFFGATDQGKRSSNEDHFSIVELARASNTHLSNLNGSHGEQATEHGCYVLTVADGVGGHKGGGVASRLAVESLVKYWLHHNECFVRNAPFPAETWEVDLTEAVLYSREALAEEGARNPEYRGMATTLTSAYLLRDQLYCVHVGDSRCYLLRDGKLEQLTSDHTMAQLYQDLRASADHGAESPLAREPASDPKAAPGLVNLLWNVIGASSESVEPQIVRERLRDQDGVLLCTDGLTKHLSTNEIEAIVNRESPEQTIVAELIDAAIRAGGSDNTTVVFCRCNEAVH